MFRTPANKEVAAQISNITWEVAKVMSGRNSNKTSLGISENVAGLLCYVLTWITGIVFYVLISGALIGIIYGLIWKKEGHKV